MGSASSARKIDQESINTKTISADEPLEFKLSNEGFDSSVLLREEIEGVKGGFKLSNVLTKKECEQVVHHMFPNQKKYQKGHTATPILFRDWDPNPEEAYKKIGVRIFTHSDDFAAALFDRCKHLLPETAETFSAKENRKLSWKIKSLHPRIRFVCYEKGQAFPPHMDDPWVQSDKVMTIYTFVIYLSACGDEKGAKYTGGELAFLHNKQKVTDDWKEITHILPEPGMVVIFPHKTLHESKELHSGVKFCIRSDIVYELVEEELGER